MCPTRLPVKHLAGLFADFVAVTIQTDSLTVTVLYRWVWVIE